MILQELHDYYLRKESNLAPDGLEWRNIPLLIELTPDGKVVNILSSDAEYLVPQVPKRANTIDPALLWDNAEYVLGIPDQKKLAARNPDKYRERVTAMHDAFRARINALPDKSKSDLGVGAVFAFYESNPVIQLQRFQLWVTIRDKNPNMAFRIQGDVNLVCQRVAPPASTEAGSDDVSGFCLITGEAVNIQRLHPPIKGVRDKPGSPSQKNIVSVNDGENPSFASYAKSQAYNSPVGKQQAFRYATALNYLLRKGSSQKLQIGDATTVFWASRESRLENDFAAFFDEPPEDNPDAGTKAVAELLAAVEQGVEKTFDNQTRFFVLGLAPNSARIAIRFWHVGTVAEMAERIARHFQDIRIVPPADRHKEPQFLSVRLLLRSIAVASSKWPDGDPEKVPPNLGGELMRAILEGLPYPETMFHGAIRRIRAGEAVSYPRAAILKACLNRRRNSKEEKVQMSLDSSNTNSGYRLGRLFAVLERTQEEAAGGHGKINATIRDRFYGAASSAPAMVFPMLLRLKNHHLGKIANVGRRKNLEALIGEIIDGLPPRFDPHLSMDNQGRFAVGYYHQRMHPSTYGKQGD